MDKQVPYNRVRAVELQQALASEFNRQEWRRAMEAAKLRWLLEGNKVEKVSASVTHKARGYYID